MTSPTVRTAMFWGLVSLGFLFLMSILYLGGLICREYLKNPGICNSVSVLDPYTPWILFILLFFTGFALLMFGIGSISNSFNPKQRRMRTKERNMERRGF